MSRVKYSNPFAMGNLDDLMIARENNDVEYLKEWSKLAVDEYNMMHGIQLDTFKALIGIKEESEKRVKEIHDLLRNNSSTSTKIEENQKDE